MIKQMKLETNERQGTMMDLNHTFVTSDHHFRDWKNCSIHEGSEEDEARHITLWNSVVGKDDLVLYVGDFYESAPVTCKGCVADLQELLGKLNGRIVLIKGNHDRMEDSVYRLAFEDVVTEMRLDELNLRLIHIKEEAKDLLPGERIIYGHEHRFMSEPPATTRDAICVCAKWHGWKPLTLAEAIRQMDATQG